MLVTDKPEGLAPTPNDLDDLPDDLLGPHPATINMSGKDLLVMDTPPEMGQFVKMEITMRCKDDGRTLLTDGGIGHYRVMSFVAAKVTTEPYKPEPEDDTPPVPDDEDPSLIDRDGSIPDDADEQGDEAQSDSGLGEFDPAFSHNNGATR